MAMKIFVRNVRLRPKRLKRKNLNYVLLSTAALVYFLCLIIIIYSSNSLTVWKILQSLAINLFTQNTRAIALTQLLGQAQLHLDLDELNRIGKSPSVSQAFKELAAVPGSDIGTKLRVMADELQKFDQERQVTAERQGHPNSNLNPQSRSATHGQISTVKQRGTSITVATAVCGPATTADALVMIKSAVLFSQDAKLHFILFSDNSTILHLGHSMLELKWTVNQLGWDFTFELFQEWFPPQTNKKRPAWREMWRPCATQRLFFPSLLPHVDSLIYLDADTIVLSNLTELWLNFERNMKPHGILAAMTPNTEYPASGHYSLNSKTPYYGFGGLQAGVALMNLTRMRGFKIQELAIKTYNKYADYIILADQDIYNTIFYFHPEKVFVLDCSYNLNWVHCGGGPEMQCVDNKVPGPICFCKEAHSRGVKIAHGNMGTFFFDDYPFLVDLYQRFSQLNLLTDSTRDLIQDLKENFKTLKTPCFYLTAEAMYWNAEKYLKNL